MKTFQRLAAVLVVAGTFLLLQPALVHAEVKGAALSRAYGQVEGQQNTIALFMHPTATLRSLAFQSLTELESGNFRLEYAFNFRAWYGRWFYSTLHFTFFANGTLDSITVGERTAMVAPFSASDVAIRWVKARVEADGELQSSPEVARTLASFDGRQVLEWWMKAGK